MDKFSKKVAFTLAEVLIAMAIIGVIADAVIPNLTRDIRNKDTVVRLKHAYSIFDQSFKLLKGKGYDIDTIFAGSCDTGGNLNVMNTFATVMPFMQNCGDNGVGCFTSIPYKNLDGTGSLNINTNSDGNVRGKAVLNNGISIAIRDYSEAGCIRDMGNGVFDHTCGDFTVDTNGAKPPHQIGRDLFYFFITRDGVFPAGHINETAHTMATCVTNGSGTGCAAKVLQENDVNY